MTSWHFTVWRFCVSDSRRKKPPRPPVKKTRALGPAGHRSVVASRELNTMTKSSHLAMHILKVRKQVFDNDDT
jgi:hypothetical protein